jgi:ferrous iron transport protein A
MVESALADPTVIPLCNLRPGQVGCIAGIVGYPALPQSRRLRDLGFLPGTRVCLLRRAPLQDPAVFGLRGYQMALRRCESRCVMVRIESTAEPSQQAG